jgi:hypothetical protein
MVGIKVHRRYELSVPTLSNRGHRQPETPGTWAKHCGSYAAEFVLDADVALMSNVRL